MVSDTSCWNRVCCAKQYQYIGYNRLGSRVHWPLECTVMRSSVSSGRRGGAAAGRQCESTLTVKHAEYNFWRDFENCARCVVVHGPAALQEPRGDQRAQGGEAQHGPGPQSRRGHAQPRVRATCHLHAQHDPLKTPFEQFRPGMLDFIIGAFLTFG